MEDFCTSGNHVDKDMTDDLIHKQTQKKKKSFPHEWLEIKTCESV